MLKWIFIAVLTLIVIALGTCWIGYKKLTAGGNSAMISIATSQARAWQYLTNPDSMLVWQDSSFKVFVANDSTGLTVGDSMVLGGVTQSGPSASRKMSFVLRRISAPSILTWVSRDDSTGMELIRRTDSLSTAGDSVHLVISFDSPGLDSISASDSVGGFTGKLLGGAQNLMASGMRIGSEKHLARLKVLLEAP